MNIRKTGESLSSTDVNQAAESNAGASVAKKRAHGHKQAESKIAQDSVQIALAKDINDISDADKFQSERAQKVAALKELIASGKYNPDSSKVAESVAAEIGAEIFSAQKAGFFDEEE